MANRSSKKSTKKILHVQKVTGISGSENHLYLLLSNLKKDEYELGFVVLTEPRKPVPNYLKMLRDAGVEVSSIHIRADFDPLCLWRLYRLIHKGKFDLVHTHLIHGDLYGTLAAKLAGVKRVVSTKHGYDNYKRTSRLYRLSGLASLWADQIVTISHALKWKCHKAEGIPLEKMVTIHYGIDAGQFIAEARNIGLRESFKIVPGELLFTSIGRLIPVKGYDYLLEAFASASQEVKAKLIIVGDGPQREYLGTKIKDFGLDGKVYLLGHRRDVSSILAVTDVFVLTTLGEGFGLVLLEAMAHRLPVISSKVMSIPEIVSDGETGLLIPPQDSDSLAQAMVRFAGNKDLRKQLGEAGWQKLITEFSVEAMVTGTEAIYDRLLRR